MGSFHLSGWHVESAIPLPELAPWQGGGAPDVTIALGPVPADPAMLVRVPGIAFHVQPDRITIATDLPPDSPAIRLFLFGTPFGKLCHLRGVLPIQASAVRVGDSAVLLAGASGMGKSALAAAFHRRGCAVIADDVTPVSDAGIALAGPGGLRLWRHTLEAFGEDIGLLEQCREGIDKFTLPAPQGEQAPIRAIIHLGAASGIGPQRLRGMDSVKAMTSAIYRARALAPGEAMRRSAGIAAQIPLHRQLLRPLDFAALDPTLDAILEAVAQL